MPSPLTLSVLVDRTSLSLSALELNDPANGMTAVVFAPGVEEWELAEDGGGSAHGADVTHSRMVNTESLVVVRFSRSTEAALDALVLTAKTALRQQGGYGISGNHNGASYAWTRCWLRRAEPVGLDGSSVGGMLDRYGHMATPPRQTVMFTIRRHPVASAGPW